MAQKRDQALYEKLYAAYRPLFDNAQVQESLTERSEAIYTQVILGVPEKKIAPLEGVIDAAQEMVETELSKTPMTQAQFNRAGNAELEVLLNMAAVSVAIREAKGEVPMDMSLQDAMIKEMQRLFAAKNERQVLAASTVSLQ